MQCFALPEPMVRPTKMPFMHVAVLGDDRSVEAEVP